MGVWDKNSIVQGIEGDKNSDVNHSYQPSFQYKWWIVQETKENSNIGMPKTSLVKLLVSTNSIVDKLKKSLFC